MVVPLTGGTPSGGCLWPWRCRSNLRPTGKRAAGALGGLLGDMEEAAAAVPGRRLTVVIVADEDTAADAERHVAARSGLLDVRVLQMQGPFRRGTFLHAGAADAARMSGGDPVLFFCDVDMRVAPSFPQGCLSEASAGRRAFFPIVWSTFRTGDPHLVREGHGQWRRYGFGMACIFWSDYAAVGGFDASIDGWGGEDAELFNRLAAKSQLILTRAPEPALVHRWHPKICSDDLSAEQLRHCRMSAMEWEGPKKRLGEMLLSRGFRIG